MVERFSLVVGFSRAGWSYLGPPKIMTDLDAAIRERDRFVNVLRESLHSVRVGLGDYHGLAKRTAKRMSWCAACDIVAEKTVDAFIAAMGAALTGEG